MKDNKHAYIFMIYNNLNVVKQSLELIDDYRNDIYIHIDKKSSCLKELKLITDGLKKSNVYYIKRMDVRWGDYSQVECEISLFKEATKKYNYAYYHLLSESDMPLKTQDEIHNFFDNNQGKEFIEIQELLKKRFFDTRYKCYHICEKNIKNKNKIIRYFSYIIMNFFVLLQYLFNFDKTKKYNLEIKYGSNWVSITDDLARYIIKNEDLIYKVFNHALCADEHFIQTITYNSKYRDRIYEKGNMRLIIWKKNENSPYVFKRKDYNTLMNSDKMFARKFQENIDLNKLKDIRKKIDR